MGEVIKGCGVDLIEIERITRALTKQRFQQRVFSPREIVLLQYKGAASWGVRFAAKEAVMKALGTGWQRGVGFNQIEILQDQWGKPYIELSGKALEIATEQQITRWLVSLSHSRKDAIAYVVAVGGEE